MFKISIVLKTSPEGRKRKLTSYSGLNKTTKGLTGLDKIIVKTALQDKKEAKAEEAKAQRD